MTIKQQIDADLKAAMLGGDKVLTTTLRGLKSAILNVEIAEGKREVGLSDEAAIALLGKEAKKRQESADLFKQGGNEEKYASEIAEKEVIGKYLPQQMDDEALNNLVETAITETGASGMQDMGKVIGLIKQRAGSSADGGRIAALVKERLSQ